MSCKVIEEWVTRYHFTLSPVEARGVNDLLLNFDSLYSRSME